MSKNFANARPGGGNIGPRPLFVFAAFLALAILFSQMAFAGGYALSGVGSKAINMGGAFRGLANDWSAAYWNPAGLTQLDKSELNAMLVALNPRPEYTPNILYPGGFEVGYRNGQVRYPDDKTSFVPDVSGFFKIPGLNGFTAGLGMFVPYGLGSRWDLFSGAGMDLANPYPLWDHKANFTVIDFHPAIAKAFLNDRLSLGVGASIQRGNITFQKAYLKPSGLPVPHENLVINSEMKGDGWGYGANGGILIKFNDKLQLGVSGKTSTTLKLKGTANQELFTLANTDLQNILLGQAQTYAETLQYRFLFNSANWHSSPSATADLKTPADLGFGLALRPNEKLTLTGDVAYTRWSSLDKIVMKLTGKDPTGAPAQDGVIMLNWSNTVRYSFGAEYLPMKELALRAGYYFDPSPVPNETFTPLIPDLGDKNSINAGGALRLYGAELSYNFEYLMFKDRTVTTLADVNGDGFFDNYPGKYKQVLYASHVSLSYRF